MNKPLKLTALLTAGLLTLGLGACSIATGDTAEVTLRVGDQIAGTEKVLEAAGELDTVPYEIEWSSFTSGPPQIEALNASQIDFAVTGNTPPVLGGDTATKVVSAYTNSAEGDAILIPPGSEITDVADLSGRTVAVARGSSAHGHLILQLEKADVDVADVDINYLQPADAKGAFEARQVDAWAVWDPYTAIAELDGAIPLVTATGVANGYGFGVASDAALADEQRSEALEDLLQRISRAYRWAAENPEEWALIYAQETGTTPEAAQLNSRATRQSIPLNETVHASQNELVGAFTRAGLLPEAFDFAGRTDSRFEQAVTGEGR